MKAKIIHRVNRNPVFWILFLGEGFKETDKNIFYNHCKMLKNQLFKIAPFNVFKKRVGVYAYLKYSNISSIDNTSRDTAYKFYINEEQNLFTAHPGIIVDDIKQLEITFKNKKEKAEKIWLEIDKRENSLVFVICNTSLKLESFNHRIDKIEKIHNKEKLIYPTYNHDGHKELTKDLMHLYPNAVVSTYPLNYQNLNNQNLKDKKRHAGAILAKMIGLAVGLEYENGLTSAYKSIERLGQISKDNAIVDELNSEVSISEKSKLREELNKLPIGIDLFDIDASFQYIPKATEKNNCWVINGNPYLTTFIIVQNENSLAVFIDKNENPNIQTYWSLYGDHSFDLNNLKWKDLIPARRRNNVELYSIDSSDINHSELKKRVKKKVLIVEEDGGDSLRFFSTKGKDLINLNALNIINNKEIFYKGGFECLMRHEYITYQVNNEERTKIIPFCKVCSKSIESVLSGNNVNIKIGGIKILKSISLRNSKGDYDKINSRLANRFYEFVKRDIIIYSNKYGFVCVQTTIYRFREFFTKKISKGISFITKKLPTIDDLPPEKAHEAWPDKLNRLRFPYLKRGVSAHNAFILWVTNQTALRAKMNSIGHYAGLGAAGAIEYLGLGRVKNKYYNYGTVNTVFSNINNTVLGYTPEYIINNKDKFQKGSIMQVWDVDPNNKIDDNGIQYSLSYLYIYAYCNKIIDNKQMVSGHSLVFMGVEEGRLLAADQYGNEIDFLDEWNFPFIIIAEWYDAIF